MTLDSSAKRGQMIAFANTIAWSPMFEPDGALDVDDRFQLLHMYGGMGAPYYGAPGLSNYVFFKRR